MMYMLKIILFILGITLAVFGYLIVFEKQYGLINDFKARKKVGSLKDEDAIRVGKVELILGMSFLILFIILLIVT